MTKKSYFKNLPLTYGVQGSADNFGERVPMNLSQSLPVAVKIQDGYALRFVLCQKSTNVVQQIVVNNEMFTSKWSFKMETCHFGYEIMHLLLVQ